MSTSNENEKVEKLLALLLLQEMRMDPKKDKVMKLNIAGFSNVEIADLLQISNVDVAKILYGTRHQSKP